MVRPRSQPGPERHRADFRRVVGAAGDNDLGAVVEGLDERLDTHLGSDHGAVLNVLRGWASASPGPMVLISPRAARAFRYVLSISASIMASLYLRLSSARRFLDDVDQPLQVGPRPAAAGGTDEQRDVPLPGGLEHRDEVALVGLAVGE